MVWKRLAGGAGFVRRLFQSSEGHERRSSRRAEEPAPRLDRHHRARRRPRRRLAANRVYLVEGSPGTGKTTLALQFLLEGAQRGEPGLYVTLSETEEELRAVAASHRWSLDGIDLFELPGRRGPCADQEQTLFHPSEVELGETMKAILDKVKAVQPKRVVFDRLSEMRLLAQDPLRYRRQILALKQFFAGQDCTVLLLDDKTGGPTRPAAAQHRARRHRARAPDAGVRRRAAPHRGAEDARPAILEATTTSSSARAGSRCSRAWSPPTITAIS